ncbi:MAG: hypothetical protein GX088_06560 [Clostridia bacterium]|nr:hypothetical protein [Clostridia bacterium]
MATTKDQKYECQECGNLVVVVEGGEGMLYCCDFPMKLVREKKATAADFMNAFGPDYKNRTLQ